MSMVRTALKSVCALSAIATVVAGSVSLIASAVAAEPLAADANAGSETITVNNATFTWGVNAESGGGSYFGGCNFLSAGVAGDNGQSGVWLQDSGLYKTSDGNVEILKPAADGTLTAASWDAKCANQYGTNINGRTAGMTMDVAEPSAGAPAEQPTYSGNVVRIANGTGTVDPATDSAHLTWKGSFTIVYYGGMTYWSLTDPVLDITDGKGTITATASGYGADMDDPSVWKKLDSRQIHLADLTNAKVDLGAQGATVTPGLSGRCRVGHHCRAQPAGGTECGERLLVGCHAAIVAGIRRTDRSDLILVHVRRR